MDSKYRSSESRLPRVGIRKEGPSTSSHAPVFFASFSYLGSIWDIAALVVRMPTRLAKTARSRRTGSLPAAESVSLYLARFEAVSTNDTKAYMIATADSCMVDSVR